MGALTLYTFDIAPKEVSFNGFGPLFYRIPSDGTGRVIVARAPLTFGGSSTFLDDDYLNEHRYMADLALNAFNNAKGRNFKLVNLLKLNQVSLLFFCMTFQAKEDGSDECLLFRGVVNLVGTDNVLLCEIRDGDESTNLGDDILSFVRPEYHYICFKHERGECRSTDGSRGGTCDYAAGSSRGKRGCAAPPPSN